MELYDIQLFCAVAAHGSFSGAATTLGLSNGTITRRIQALETSLGTRLINRSTRNMELTEFGQQLFRRSQPLVQELEGIRQELLQGQDKPTGLISILLPLEFFSPQFSKMLSGFAREYPGIKIQCSHYVDHFPPFISGEDLCFAWYEDALPDSDWIATPLMSLPQACYAAPGHGCLKVTDLTHMPCITQPGENRWHFRQGGRITAIEVNGRFRFNSPGLRLQAAINGEGICKLPCYLGDPCVQKGQLEKLILNGDVVALVVSIGYRTRNLPLKIRVFIDYFQTRLAQEM